jgi:phosphatidate cytidylyltransferase
MLKTRLWMGAVLILVTVGVLFLDQHLPPWFPSLFVFQMGLTLAACHELVRLLGTQRSPQQLICYVSVVAFVFANWLVNYPAPHAHSWTLLIGIQAGFLLVLFLYEMATFTAPGRSVERMALTWFIVGYLGLLPCFFAQIRWLTPVHQDNTVRLALAAFVPKCCDIGAYCVGRLIGRHKMTPVLSPKKTWEGAIGGLLTAALAAIAIDRLWLPVLGTDLRWEIGFGISVGLAGMLGDLAESLLKRDCQTKDASSTVPGFGGVLDVVDAIIYSAPVSYLWFCAL